MDILSFTYGILALGILQAIVVLAIEYRKWKREHVILNRTEYSHLMQQALSNAKPVRRLVEEDIYDVH